MLKCLRTLASAPYCAWALSTQAPTLGHASVWYQNDPRNRSEWSINPSIFSSHSIIHSPPTPPSKIPNLAVAHGHSPTKPESPLSQLQSQKKKAIWPHSPLHWILNPFIFNRTPLPIPKFELQIWMFSPAGPLNPNSKIPQHPLPEVRSPYPKPNPSIQDPRPPNSKTHSPFPKPMQTQIWKRKKKLLPNPVPKFRKNLNPPPSKLNPPEPFETQNPNPRITDIQNPHPLFPIPKKKIVHRGQRLAYRRQVEKRAQRFLWKNEMRKGFSDLLSGFLTRRPIWNKRHHMWSWFVGLRLGQVRIRVEFVSIQVNSDPILQEHIMSPIVRKPRPFEFMSRTVNRSDLTLFVEKPRSSITTTTSTISSQSKADLTTIKGQIYFCNCGAIWS